MSDGDWLGPLIGIGFAAVTLKFLSGLNLNPTQQTEIGDLLLHAKNYGDGYMIRVRNQNLPKAKRILNMSGFKVISLHQDIPGITYLKFVEKLK